jgi:hypothetical protein
MWKNYSYILYIILLAILFYKKIKRQRTLVVEINFDKEDDEKTKVRSLDEEKFESNGLGDNKQNEDEVHILERTSNHIALEEAIECETRIKKKLMILNQ